MPTQDTTQDIEIENDAPKEIEIDDEKILALAQHLEIARDDEDILNISDDGRNVYCYGHKDYLVLTDDEADKMQDEYFEQYLDEILSELPDIAQRYFDRDAWKRDAEFDGRGILSSYDGEEHEEQVDGTWYYVYRV